MIELIISVCMFAQPDVCKDVHLTYSAENMTPFQCLMRGQPEIAQWANGHPKWQVRRWRCGHVRLGERNA